jgi:hypothetical protein
MRLEELGLLLVAGAEGGGELAGEGVKVGLQGQQLLFVGGFGVLEGGLEGGELALEAGDEMG